MSTRRSLTICRSLIVVLLFNMAFSVVAATKPTESGFTWLCTSSGLVKVDLDGRDESAGTSVAQSDHCPYCKLSEPTTDISTDLPAYPTPDTQQALHYRDPYSPMLQLHTLSFVQLRAPPNLHLNN